jgi:hypothetical protein
MLTAEALRDWKEMLGTLIPPGDTVEPRDETKDHLAAVIMILALDHQTLALAFDDTGKFKGDVLHQRYPELLNTGLVTVERLNALHGSRLAFAIVNAYWRRLLRVYEPGPCPGRAAMGRLVKFTETFKCPDGD